MAGLADFQVPPPAKWEDFEDLCLDLWRKIWRDENAQKNGRRGQPQNGGGIPAVYCPVSPYFVHNPRRLNIPNADIRSEIQSRPDRLLRLYYCSGRPRTDVLIKDLP